MAQHWTPFFVPARFGRPGLDTEASWERKMRVSFKCMGLLGSGGHLIDNDGSA